MTDHVPVPADHAPRKQTLVQGKHVHVEERTNPNDAWITMDVRHTMEVEQ